MSHGAPIEALPSLGPASARMLARAGIAETVELRRLGAVEAYVRVEEAGERPSLSLLYALEGALLASHWTRISRTERTRPFTELEALRELRNLGRASVVNRKETAGNCP